ncbi:hypothetical protein HK098_005369, partial [Nowakowskiella sp. JEL0407]
YKGPLVQLLQYQHSISNNGVQGTHEKPDHRFIANSFYYSINSMISGDHNSAFTQLLALWRWTSRPLEVDAKNEISDLMSESGIDEGVYECIDIVCDLKISIGCFLVVCAELADAYQTLAEISDVYKNVQQVIEKTVTNPNRTRATLDEKLSRLLVSLIPSNPGPKVDINFIPSAFLIYGLFPPLYDRILSNTTSSKLISYFADALRPPSATSNSNHTLKFVFKKNSKPILPVSFNLNRFEPAQVRDTRRIFALNWMINQLCGECTNSEVHGSMVIIENRIGDLIVELFRLSESIFESNDGVLIEVVVTAILEVFVSLRMDEPRRKNIVGVEIEVKQSNEYEITVRG